MATDANMVVAPLGAAPPSTVVPVRHPGRWAAAALIAALGVIAVHSMATNPRFQWSVVGNYLFAAPILKGLGVTLELTVIAMVMGIAIGVIVAVGRMSSNPLIAGASSLYVWLFRGTPVLVQLLFWSFVSALYPRLSLGVPFGGPTLVEGSANTLITPFTAAILGLGLNEGAYMAEIVRGGIASVDEGQTEAAHALGMTPGLTLRRVILPQAMRMIIPPTGNETISMLKTTSLVSVIAYAELLYSAQLIYSANYRTIPLLIVASLWYLLVTSVLSVGQYYLERHLARGLHRRQAVTPWQRARAALTARRARGGLA